MDLIPTLLALQCVCRHGVLVTLADQRMVEKPTCGWPQFKIHAEYQPLRRKLFILCFENAKSFSLQCVYTHTHTLAPPPPSNHPPYLTSLQIFSDWGKDRSNDNLIHTGKVLLVFFSFEIVNTDLSELVLERRRHLRLGFVLKGPSLPQIVLFKMCR